MQNELLAEIRLLKAAISTLIGNSDLPAKERFSKEALARAAKEFKKLSIERGEWLTDSNISKIIRNAHYGSAAFIIKEFGFTNYFKRGHTLYLNKKDLIELSKELKKRNIDLGRYMEYRADQEKFKKYLETADQNKGGRKKKKPFEINSDIRDVTTSPAKPPAPELIREDIARLKDEFFASKLSEYIDIYGGNHAMLKTNYFYEKYLEPGLKRKCKKWCDDFNYANHALLLFTNKKEIFVPVKEEDMIQL